MKNLFLTALLCFFGASLVAQSPTKKTSSNLEHSSEVSNITEKDRNKQNNAKSLRSPGSADPTDAYFETSGQGWSVIKARSDNYQDDSTSIKLTNMTDAGTGTEFVIQSVNEEGLSFSSNSDVSSNTTDDILVLQPNGDVILGEGTIEVFSTSSVNGINAFNDLGSNLQLGINNSTHPVAPDYSFLWNYVSGIRIGTAGTERMRIDPNGYISMGSPSAPPFSTLHVKKLNNFIGSGLTLENDTGNGNDYWSLTMAFDEFQMYYDADGPGTTDSYTFKAQLSHVDGVWSSASDRRLKNNINEMETGILGKVLSLKPSRYFYNDDKSNTKCVGLVAQDVQKIFPEIVRKNGEHLTISYPLLSVYLAKAIQEQQAVIEDSKVEYEALQKNYEELKARLLNLEAMILSKAKN